VAVVSHKGSQVTTAKGPMQGEEPAKNRREKKSAARPSITGAKNTDIQRIKMEPDNRPKVQNTLTTLKKAAGGHSQSGANLKAALKAHQDRLDLKAGKKPTKLGPSVYGIDPGAPKPTTAAGRIGNAIGRAAKNIADASKQAVDDAKRARTLEDPRRLDFNDHKDRSGRASTPPPPERKRDGTPFKRQAARLNPNSKEASTQGTNIKPGATSSVADRPKAKVSVSLANAGDSPAPGNASRPANEPKTFAGKPGQHRPDSAASGSAEDVLSSAASTAARSSLDRNKTKTDAPKTKTDAPKTKTDAPKTKTDAPKTKTKPNAPITAATASGSSPVATSESLARIMRILSIREAARRKAKPMSGEEEVPKTADTSGRFVPIEGTVHVWGRGEDAAKEVITKSVAGREQKKAMAQAGVPGVKQPGPARSSRSSKSP